jgi:hypothetical protein
MLTTWKIKPKLIAEGIDCTECKSDSDYKDFFKNELIKRVGFNWFMNSSTIRLVQPEKEFVRFRFDCSKVLSNNCPCKYQCVLVRVNNTMTIISNSKKHNHR